MTQDYYCVMIPTLIPYPKSLWRILPPGIYDATLEEVYSRFVFNQKRKDLFAGLTKGLDNLFASGCQQIFLDGSYISEKAIPQDYDVCWDARFVDPRLLDPVFLDFTNKRANQKKKYLGEFFPAYAIDSNTGQTFLEFFQKDKQTGLAKGIIRIESYLKSGG
jgi:hypothetical protein